MRSEEAEKFSHGISSIRSMIFVRQAIATQQSYDRFPCALIDCANRWCRPFLHALKSSTHCPSPHGNGLFDVHELSSHLDDGLLIHESSSESTNGDSG